MIYQFHDGSCGAGGLYQVRLGRCILRLGASSLEIAPAASQRTPCADLVSLGDGHNLRHDRRTTDRSKIARIYTDFSVVAEYIILVFLQGKMLIL